MELRIIFMRHGKYDYNSEFRSLTREGVAQILTTAWHLAQKQGSGRKALFVSDAFRAMQSGAILWDMFKGNIGPDGSFGVKDNGPVSDDFYRDSFLQSKAADSDPPYIRAKWASLDDDYSVKERMDDFGDTLHRLGPPSSILNFGEEEHENIGEVYVCSHEPVLWEMSQALSVGLEHKTGHWMEGAASRVYLDASGLGFSSPREAWQMIKGLSPERPLDPRRVRGVEFFEPGQDASFPEWCARADRYLETRFPKLSRAPRENHPDSRPG